VTSLLAVFEAAIRVCWRCIVDLQQSHRCRFKSEARLSGIIQSWVDLPIGNETAMLLALKLVGPLAAAVDATPISFQVHTPPIHTFASFENGGTEIFPSPDYRTETTLKFFTCIRVTSSAVNPQVRLIGGSIKTHPGFSIFCN